MRFAREVPYQGQYEKMLELEVVGFYRYALMWGGYSPTAIIYVPDSLLPHTFVHRTVEIEEIAGDEIGIAGVDTQHAHWYSFTLHDPRDESAFLLENRDDLAALGINVGFIPSNAAEFWNSAEPILQSTLFNLVTFGSLSVMVLAFIAFLYLRQNRRSFAILRALGTPKKKALRQQLVTALYFALPAAIIGGIGLSMLLMLQNARDAAIMRVLGGTKLKSRNILTMESLLVCVLGLLIGLCILIFTSWGFGVVSAFLLMGLYFVGVLIGSIAGAILVTNRPPLDLLQVKE